jgi:hypothetical protein
MQASIPAPVLGEHFDVHVPENSHPAVVITIVDRTSPGTFDADRLRNLVWAQRYQDLFHYNRSPWVERDLSAPIADVVLIGPDEQPPADSYHVELLDTSTEPGALGWHEDEAHASSAHSARGKAAGTEQPLAKVFCKTSKEDGIEPTEVVSHEILEMIVDPWVTNEADIRKYLNPADHFWYIGEVGDPVQDRGYDVGAPEGRPCGVPEAIVADFAYPYWWGQAQRRTAVCFCDDGEAWKTLPAVPHLQPFELAPGGYMSRAPEANPEEWGQIYGSDRPKAEARAKAFERPGEIG